MTQAKNVALGVSNINSSGVLQPAGGGTGLASFTANGAVYSTSTSALTTGVLPVVAGGTGSSTGYFASGTALLFYQASAPTGWTKSTTNNNKALRVVSGATGGSSGGTVAFTTAFASQAVSGTVGTSGSTTATGTVGTSGSTTVSGSVGNTTLTTTTLPSHNHGTVQDTAGLSQGTVGLGGGDFCRSLYYRDAADGNGLRWGTDYTGSSGAHNHSFSGDAHTHTGGTFTGTAHTHTGGTFTGTAIDLAVQYIDVIVATKD